MAIQGPESEGTEGVVEMGILAVLAVLAVRGVATEVDLDDMYFLVAPMAAATVSVRREEMSFHLARVTRSKRRKSI
jgi:uncharacterized protein YcaQ